MQAKARLPTLPSVSVLNPAFFKALCDPSRLSLLMSLLSKSESTTVSEIAATSGCGIDLSVVSRHLAVLRDAGVLEAVKQGRQVLYRVRVEEVVQALRTLADMLEQYSQNKKK